MQRRPTVRNEEFDIFKAYGKGRDDESAKKTTFINLNDEDSDENNVERNITTEKPSKERRTVRKDEDKNEAGDMRGGSKRGFDGKVKAETTKYVVLDDDAEHGPVKKHRHGREDVRTEKLETIVLIDTSDEEDTDGRNDREVKRRNEGNDLDKIGENVVNGGNDKGGGERVDQPTAMKKGTEKRVMERRYKRVPM